MERSSVTVELIERAAGLGVALVSGTVLGIATWLKPDGAGHGTHTQLNLPRCGWVSMLDKPCPTCGMTTAFGHAAQGEFAQSAITQPAGAVLSVLAAAMVWGGVHKAVWGARVDRMLIRLINKWSLLGGGIMLLAAWGYKLMIWDAG